MRKYIFWGLLLMIVGALWLLKLTSFVNFSWRDAFYLWPLILVWVGIGVLPIRDGFKVLLDIITMAIGVLILINPCETKHYCNHDEKQSKVIKTITYSDDNYQNAKLTFNAGATEIRFFPNKENLIDILGERSENVDISITEECHSREVDVTLAVLPHKSNVINGPYKIMLNPAPIWEMDINLGASNNHIDLSDFKVKELELSSGASDIFLKIGELHPDVNIELGVGASSVKIEVPASMECTIENSSALSSNHFQGFTKKEKGIYYSTSSDSISKGKIHIAITSGVSNISVVKY